MKLKVSQLRAIIKEEVKRVILENEAAETQKMVDTAQSMDKQTVKNALDDISPEDAANLLANFKKQGLTAQKLDDIGDSISSMNEAEDDNYVMSATAMAPALAMLLHSIGPGGAVDPAVLLGAVGTFGGAFLLDFLSNKAKDRAKAQGRPWK